MTKEIKEILDIFTKYKDDWYSVKYILKPKQCVALYDYITNLQEKNTKLKDLCDKYEEEHKTTFEEWKKDIKANKKAIEYIEIGLANEEEAEELLNILQGSE